MPDLDKLTQAERKQIHEIRNKGGEVRHENGTISTSSTRVKIDPSIEIFIISNTHASQDLLVSFDGGTNFFTVAAVSSLTMERARVGQLHLKGSGSGTTYEIIGW